MLNAFFLSALLFFQPMSRDAYVKSLASWAGCTANVETDDTASPVDSFYRYHNLYIGTDPKAPDYVLETVVFHEVGHCLQYQQNYMRDLWFSEGIIAVELDADRWSAQLMCGRGWDGMKRLHDTFVWLLHEYSYRGDYFHGTLDQRISQGEKADYCKVNPQQAPFQSR